MGLAVGVVGSSRGAAGSWSVISSSICWDRVPSSNFNRYGSLEGSKGELITVAFDCFLDSGWGAKTVVLSWKGGGRCRMLSRSALEVYVKDLSYFSLNWGLAGKVRINLMTFPSVKSR